MRGSAPQGIGSISRFVKAICAATSLARLLQAPDHPAAAEGVAEIKTATGRDIQLEHHKNLGALITPGFDADRRLGFRIE